MDESLSWLVGIAMSLLLTVAVISIALGQKGLVDNVVAHQQLEEDSIARMTALSKLARYDESTVSGAEVISALYQLTVRYDGNKSYIVRVGQSTNPAAADWYNYMPTATTEEWPKTDVATGVKLPLESLEVLEGKFHPISLYSAHIETNTNGAPVAVIFGKQP